MPQTLAGVLFLLGGGLQREAVEGHWLEGGYFAAKRLHVPRFHPVQLYLFGAERRQIGFQIRLSLRGETRRNFWGVLKTGGVEPLTKWRPGWFHISAQNLILFISDSSSECGAHNFEQLSNRYSHGLLSEEV